MIVFLFKSIGIPRDFGHYTITVEVSGDAAVILLSEFPEQQQRVFHRFLVFFTHIFHKFNGDRADCDRATRARYQTCALLSCIAEDGVIGLLTSDLVYVDGFGCVFKGPSTCSGTLMYRAVSTNTDAG